MKGRVGLQLALTDMHTNKEPRRLLFEALKMAATYSPTIRSTIGVAVCGRLCRLSAPRARERAHRTPHTVRTPHRRHRARL